MDLGSGIAKTSARESGRRLPNWITSFTRLTENLDSPEIFRKWAGISILGSVLERKVWNGTAKGILYPNLYVVLVGPPGAGKSAIISQSEKLLRQVDGLQISPSSVTAASLIDTLQLSVRKVLHPYFIQFNSLQVIASELQNFLPAYEPSFMGVLTKLYDCELYEERRRTGKVQHIRIDSTQLSLLAGTTPSYMNQLLPEGAWDQGFTSRTIFVYSEKSADQTDLFYVSDADIQMKREGDEDLLHDLRSMMTLAGQIRWRTDAREAIQAWARGGAQPVPEHGRLTHYNSRRVTHVLKLALIASVARSDEPEVLPEDLDTATGWLLEAENYMPDIFRAMTTTPESRSMEDARFYIKQMHDKLKNPVPEHYLIDFLKHRTAPQNIAKMIEVMIKSRMLVHKYDSMGNATYTPFKG
jgi:hypothetical protein